MSSTLRNFHLFERLDTSLSRPVCRYCLPSVFVCGLHSPELVGDNRDFCPPSFSDSWFLIPSGNIRPFPFFCLRRVLGDLFLCPDDYGTKIRCILKQLKTECLDILFCKYNKSGDSHTITQYNRYLLIIYSIFLCCICTFEWLLVIRDPIWLVPICTPVYLSLKGMRQRRKSTNVLETTKNFLEKGLTGTSRSSIISWSI